MTFSAYETSNHDGEPVGLYKFAWGFTEWFYTSADQDIVFGGDTYSAIAISDDGFKQGGNTRPDITVKVESSIPLMALFRGTPPSQPVIMTVRHMHADDVSGEAPIRWVGRIGNVKRVNPVEAEITCRNAGLRRNGLRLTWSRACPHFLYGFGCDVDKSLHDYVRTIETLDGTTINMVADGSAPDPALFNGGFVEWDADGLGTIERRGIEITTGTNGFRLFGRTDGLEVGMELTFYKGCNRTAEICDSVFNNLPNYGGVNIAGKSPYDGTQVF